jgi:hypothetical protein
MQHTTLPDSDTTCRTGTEDTCSGVSSFFFTQKEYENIELRSCPILNTPVLAATCSEGRYLSIGPES